MEERKGGKRDREREVEGRRGGGREREAKQVNRIWPFSPFSFFPRASHCFFLSLPNLNPLYVLLLLLCCLILWFTCLVLF